MEDKNESMNLEKSLIDEMTDFVSKIEPRKETVEILLNKIVESTSEVKKLLKDLSKISTSEEANNSLLHKTVRSLINLSKNQNIQTEIRLLANECLGYLGPLNLNTITLYVEEITDSNEGLIRLLLEYVANSDSQVSESAIYGLKRVLCSNIDKKSIPKVWIFMKLFL